MNEFQEGLADTPARTSAERHVELLRQQGGLFVEAVRVTRMPMLVTDPTLPGNPITFANAAFMNLSGYSMDELLGQDPHFMNGPDTDLEAIAQYQAAMEEGRDVNLELLQYHKDGTSFRAMLFATPLNDGQGRVTNHFLSYLDITRRHSAFLCSFEFCAPLARGELTKLDYSGSLRCCTHRTWSNGYHVNRYGASEVLWFENRTQGYSLLSLTKTCSQVLIHVL